MTSRKCSNSKRKTSSIVTIILDDDDDNSFEINSASNKRRKVVEEEVEEVRLLPYRTRRTNAIRDRIHRALYQRLYLLAASRYSDIHRKYQVLGQTGNVYTVIISHLPSCSCPDHANGHLCKHIIFVLHRVLKVPRQSALIYQQALLTSELKQIFTNADSQTRDASIFPEKSICDAYESETRRIKTTSKMIHRKVLSQDDECPICFETMIDESQPIIFCSKSCGNNIHKNCFEKWEKAKLSMKESVTCPLCRNQWRITSNVHQGSRNYLNLAAYSTTDDYNADEEYPIHYNIW